MKFSERLDYAAKYEEWADENGVEKSPFGVICFLEVEKVLLGDEQKVAMKEIAHLIQYWIDWITRDRADHGLDTKPDTSIMRPPPPYWPSVSQLTNWIRVLKNEG